MWVLNRMVEVGVFLFAAAVVVFLLICAFARFARPRHHSTIGHGPYVQESTWRVVPAPKDER